MKIKKIMTIIIRIIVAGVIISTLFENKILVITSISIFSFFMATTLLPDHIDQTIASLRSWVFGLMGVAIGYYIIFTLYGTADSEMIGTIICGYILLSICSLFFLVFFSILLLLAVTVLITDDPGIEKIFDGDLSPLDHF